MNQDVKPLALITIAILLLQPCLTAQLRLPIVNNIASDLKKVIEDYPNNFMNLQGELLIEHAQSADYAYNFKVNGAEQASVTIYSSVGKKVASWQALLLTTEDFEEARKKFRALYGQLQHLNLTMADGHSILFKGHYEEPVEERKFTSSLFSCESKADSHCKLKVEIVMAYEPMEWKVKLLVYDRDREDHERGPKTEQ